MTGDPVHVYISGQRVSSRRWTAQVVFGWVELPNSNFDVGGQFLGFF